jgi:hypothetical protein
LNRKIGEKKKRRGNINNKLKNTNNYKTLGNPENIGVSG